MTNALRFDVLLATILFLCPAAFAHEGPDPVLHWNLKASLVKQSKLSARLGPDALIDGELAAVQSGKFQSLRFDGKDLSLIHI